MEWLAAPLGFAKYVLTGLVMYGCFMVAEHIRPAEPHQPLSHIWFNLRWYVVYSLIVVLIQALGIGVAITWIQELLGAPLISLPIPQ
ncbi:MAG: sterol desaturase family protein, partial [Cyanobacteria bacterium P01_E01_bin.43]